VVFLRLCHNLWEKIRRCGVDEWASGVIVQIRRRLNVPGARQVLKFAITLGLLGLLAAKVDIRAVGARIGSIGFGACAVCVMVTLGLSVLVALRWQLILARLHTPTRLVVNWRLVMIGLFFNQILPSGLGGDAVRVWLLARGGGQLQTAILSVAADRIFALSAVVLCMASFLPLLLHGPAGVPVLALSLGGAAGIAVLLKLDQVLGWAAPLVPRRLRQAAEKRAGPVLVALRDLAGVLRLVLRTWPDGLAVLAISVVNQLALGWIVYFIARRLHVEIGLVTVMALFSPAFLLSMMPFSVGGWGVREAALVWLLGTAHVPQDAALATSLLFGLVTTAAGLPGGMLWLFERREGKLPEMVFPITEKVFPAP
jgi:glycosyltransferase 2 family protein